MPKPTIEFTDLSIGYVSKGKEPKTVASGINVSLMPGELTCLLGPNGAGKSTLFKTIAGFIPPLHGTIAIDKRTNLTAKEKAKLLGVVLTGHNDIPNMTVRELVAMGRSPYTGFFGRLSDTDEAIVMKAMKDVGIERMVERQVTTLSDGERQKVMIAKALAQQTPIIILDEPTAFLDYPSKVDTMQLLLRLCHEQSKTIILSTHDVEIALQMADKLWLLDTGKITIGTTRELADTGDISRFIDREHIKFNTEDLTIRITKPKQI